MKRLINAGDAVSSTRTPTRRSAGGGPRSTLLARKRRAWRAFERAIDIKPPIDLDELMELGEAFQRAATAADRAAARKGHR